jgi:hypothetical protein
MPATLIENQEEGLNDNAMLVDNSSSSSKKGKGSLNLRSDKSIDFASINRKTRGMMGRGELKDDYDNGSNSIQYQKFRGVNDSLSSGSSKGRNRKLTFS